MTSVKAAAAMLRWQHSQMIPRPQPRTDAHARSMPPGPQGRATA